MVVEEVKLYLKSGAWPLSAFGPFGGLGNFPNHIEDYSFEECRLQHYMAQQEDRLTIYELQYAREIDLATMKTANLIKMSPEILLETLIEIYDQPLIDSSSVASVRDQTSDERKCQVQPQSVPGFQTNCQLNISGDTARASNRACLRCWKAAWLA